MKELEKIDGSNVEFTKNKVIFNREFWEKTMNPVLLGAYLNHNEFLKLLKNKRELLYFLKERIEETTSKSKKVIYEEILNKLMR